MIRGYADSRCWPEISKIIKMKNPPVPFATIAEILYAADNRELASDTFCKVSDKELRVDLLLDFQFWAAAMEEICKTRQHEDYEEILFDSA